MQEPTLDDLPEPVMSIDDIEQFLESEFPQVAQDGRVFSVTDVSHGRVVYQMTPLDRHLRPGGTVAGPSMFALADVAAYICILAHIGPRKHTVTTNMNINFMRKPEPGPLDCHARLLKLGKRLAVVDSLTLDKDGQAVSQATATYSIPSE